MTSEDSTGKPEGHEGPPSDRPSDPIAQMLRGALDKAPTPEHSLLPRIQQRIRIITRGRYYRDRWSATRDPVSLLLMVALLILILAAALFLVMQPLVDAPQKTQLPTPAEDLMAPSPNQLPPNQPGNTPTGNHPTNLGTSAPPDDREAPERASPGTWEGAESAGRKDDQAKSPQRKAAPTTVE